MSSIKGVPIVIPVVLAMLVVFTLLLNRTVFGRHVYAVGGNAEAARRAGINVPRIKLLCFVLCSTIAAAAGVLLASRVNSVTPTTGGGETLLYAVGAAVIGGTSLFGGKGRPVDAVIGGLVVAVVANGMGLLDQSAAVGDQALGKRQPSGVVDRRCDAPGDRWGHTSAARFARLDKIADRKGG